MKVLVSDRDGTLIKSILDNTDWEIILYIYDDSTSISSECLNSARIKKHMNLTEVMNVPLPDTFSIDKIRQFNYAFNIADYGYKRIMNDMHFSHYSFYHAISFWDNFFIANKIDLCFCTGQNHGFDEDYIMQEISKYYKIPTFHLYFSNPGKFVLYNVIDDSFINCKEITPSKNYILHDEIQASCNTFFTKVKRFVKNCLPDMLVFLIKNTFSPRDAVYYYKFTNFSYISNYLKAKRILKRNKKYYVDVDYGKKFVVYFLHFEPEAVVTNCAGYMDSQIINIEILSRSVPKGWKIYVKEHPDMYKLNDKNFYYFIPCITNYVTEYFYSKIDSLDNVNLIDYKIPSKNLMDRASAVATIAGTISSEATECNKPVILFGQTRMFYWMDKDYLRVDSVDSCKRALKKIEDGFIPEYKFTKEKMHDYSVEVNDDNRNRFIDYIDNYIKREMSKN